MLSSFILPSFPQILKESDETSIWCFLFLVGRHHHHRHHPHGSGLRASKGRQENSYRQDVKTTFLVIRHFVVLYVRLVLAWEIIEKELRFLDRNSRALGISRAGNTYNCLKIH